VSHTVHLGVCSQPATVAGTPHQLFRGGRLFCEGDSLAAEIAFAKLG
jgi:hypothetical protein